MSEPAVSASSRAGAAFFTLRDTLLALGMFAGLRPFGPTPLSSPIRLGSRVSP